MAKMAAALLGEKRGGALDIGCGEGKFTRGLTALCKPVHGVDVKEKAIAKAREAAKEAGGHETLLHKEDGTVTECGHSSFFAVLDGCIITHPSGPRILPGITRDLILELAAGCSIPVRQRPLRVDELSKCQEMFLTSTSAEILPIVMVDEDRVGTGKPGPVTKSIQAAFARHLSDWLVSDESSDSALI